MGLSGYKSRPDEPPRPPPPPPAARGWGGEVRGEGCSTGAPGSAGPHHLVDLFHERSHHRITVEGLGCTFPRTITPPQVSIRPQLGETGGRRARGRAQENCEEY